MSSAALIDLLKRSALPTLCFLMICYFGLHALFGSSGYFALDEIRQSQAELQAEQADLMARKAAVSRDIALLDPQGADPDFTDELVRRHLGVIRPDELIVRLEDPAVSG